MKIEDVLRWLDFPFYDAEHRAYSFSGAVEYGFNPSLYWSTWRTSPTSAEVMLDFKIWMKGPCLTCYFRNIRTGGKFCLTAFDNKGNGRYTPRDNGIDFSDPKIEGGLYLVTMTNASKKGSVWDSATLLLPPERKGEIWLRIATTYVGSR